VHGCDEHSARLDDEGRRNDERLENVYWVDDPSDGNPPPNANVVLSLANVSRMFNIGRLRLLCYEALGLTKRRYRNGRLRTYGWADCERIALIIKTQRAGLAIKDIMPVLRATDGSMQAPLRRRGLARCTRLIDRLEERRRLLDNAINELQHVCAQMAAESSDHDRAVRRG
jgi:DNA-binding transcriptional MerR regulator